MRILGIDPGLAIVGYSILDIEKDENILITSGSIQTDKNKADAERLLEIQQDLTTIVDKYKPDVASIEKLFYFKNQKTGQHIACLYDDRQPVHHRANHRKRGGVVHSG